ncbi:MAG: hypothetical protein WBG73_22915 [Coleofasciculaceae cyanobacterium]
MLIFFIHGVATRDAQYAEPLRTFIRQEFNNKGIFPHFHSSFWGNFLGDRDKMWNNIEQDLQELRQESPQTNLEDIFRYRKFRDGLLSQFVGDFLAYLNPQRGIAIRKVIAQDLYHFLHDNPEETEIHIIAHSLGSVILWDVLFSERFSPQDPALEIRAMINGLNQPNAARLLNSITTMGSPILFLNTMLDVKPEQVKQFVAGYQKKPLSWVNIIHASDIIAYPLRASLKLNSSDNLYFKDKFLDNDANSLERTLSDFAKSDNKIVQAIGVVNPLINEAVAYAPMLVGAADSHIGYWNCRQTASLITANILGKNQLNTIKPVIDHLNKVDGMTNKKVADLRLHVLDKTLEELKFKDGSGKLLLMASPVKVHYVYVFDRYDNCKFAGYVGWIHVNGLIKKVKFIKSQFC